MTRPERSSARLLDFRSGGWVVLLAVLLTGAAVGLRLADSSRSRGARAVGDGKSVETYGFDLTYCAVAREALAAAGIPKDGIRALNLPPLLRPEQADSIARRTHRKLLVSGDRVIGVVVNGRARAYPIRFMNWHEVVNDTLGARPIAVTYSPLCDAVAVFDREVEDKILRFGVSGLLYNSNLLMYDDQPANREESLWSQLRACVIAGPRARYVSEPPSEQGVPAEAELRILPVSLVGWADWRERHPETTVIAPDPALAGEYRRDPYASYFASDGLRFPVVPIPNGGGLDLGTPNDGLDLETVNDKLDLKTPMIMVKEGGSFRAFAVSEIARQAGPDGIWRADVNGTPVLFRYRSDPPSVTAESVDSSPPPPVLYAFWFAWRATQPHSATKLLGGRP